MYYSYKHVYFTEEGLSYSWNKCFPYRINFKTRVSLVYLVHHGSLGVYLPEYRWPWFVLKLCFYEHVRAPIFGVQLGLIIISRCDLCNGPSLRKPPFDVWVCQRVQKSSAVQRSAEQKDVILEIYFIKWKDKTFRLLNREAPSGIISAVVYGP